MLPIFVVGKKIADKDEQARLQLAMQINIVDTSSVASMVSGHGSGAASKIHAAPNATFDKQDNPASPQPSKISPEVFGEFGLMRLKEQGPAILETGSGPAARTAAILENSEPQFAGCQTSIHEEIQHRKERVL